MFVEIHKNISEELELLIKSMGLSYEISDCTLENEKAPMMHIELGEITNTQRNKINEFVSNLKEQTL